MWTAAFFFELRTENHKHFPTTTSVPYRVHVRVVESRHFANMFKRLIFYTLLIAQCVHSMRWEEVEVRQSPVPVRGEFTFQKLDDESHELYLYGGCDITFSIFYNDLWLLSRVPGKNTMTWTQVETFGDKPVGSCGHGSAIVDGRMYVYGGLTANGTSNQFHKLDFHTLKWTKIQTSQPVREVPPPRALIQHSMVTTGVNTFVLGSGISSDKHDDDSTFQFNTDTALWERISIGQIYNETDIGGSSISFDWQNKEAILLGGYKKGTLDELGKLKINRQGAQRWEKIPISTRNKPVGPIAFQASRMIYSNKSSCMLIDGGFNQDNLNANLWVLQFTSASLGGASVSQNDRNGILTASWKSLTTTNSPPPHFASGFEILNNRYLYVFGGRIHPKGKGEELWGGLWRLNLDDYGIC